MWLGITSPSLICPFPAHNAQFCAEIYNAAGARGAPSSMTNSSPLPLLLQAERHGTRTAVTDLKGTYTYQALLDASARVAAVLLDGGDDLQERTVAFRAAPGFPWVAVLWGIWRAGGIAVPLPLGSPVRELEYLLDDARPVAVVSDADEHSRLASLAAARNLRALSCDQALAHRSTRFAPVSTDRRAMILYTSGTTSRPKGVVSTHDQITAQITTLVRAWEWSADDRAVLCLPLHHIHGIINVLSCSLWAGATCEMLPRFDAHAVWERIASGRATVLMAVPTIYAKLIAAWDAALPERRAALSRACRRLRLMVSGSAALSLATLEKWRAISGCTLLERYGMTEIGMALSNPLRGTRVPGSVGTPLPGVEVRLVDEAATLVAPGMPGEIQVRGLGVFQEYWNRPDETRQAFRDGWFRTGDMAVFENGVYRILGRTSVDIIKTGGHKVSALEIEEVLLEHPHVSECAVVGVPDPTWGERVGAAVVLRPGNALELEGLRSWAKDRLAAHKLPSRLLVLDSLPRNALGKVVKPSISHLFLTASRPS